MIIKELCIKNFRNIKYENFSFSDKINIIYGDNAQGKTNLMESIACAVEKSFRTNKSADMISQCFYSDNEDCRIKLGFVSEKFKDKLNYVDCFVHKKGIERKINNISFKEALQLYPQLKIIIFIPEDLYIIKGNPETRRELIDETVDMMNKIHHNMVGIYNKALKQKNSFLSSLTESKISPSQRLQIEVWNEELAKAGVNVMCGRLKYFSVLCKYASEYYKELNNNNEIFSAEYNSSIIDKEDFDLNDSNFIFNAYLDKLERYFEKEIIVHHTLVGVHRDDINFYINKRSAKDYASQGQVRSIALALRLAQAKMFSEKWEEPPVIILDDVLSELDGYRRSFILNHILNSQVFITGCNDKDFSEIKKSMKWKAENGSFKQLLC